MINLSKSLENHNNLGGGISSSSQAPDRKYNELIAALKKRDAKKQEAIGSLAKKLKQLEQKLQEETQVSVELKKRHDIMQKKLEVASKGKAEMNKQLK